MAAEAGDPGDLGLHQHDGGGKGKAKATTGIGDHPLREKDGIRTGSEKIGSVADGENIIEDEGWNTVHHGRKGNQRGIYQQGLHRGGYRGQQGGRGGYTRSWRPLDGSGSSANVVIPPVGKLFEQMPQRSTDAIQRRGACHMFDNLRHKPVANPPAIPKVSYEAAFSYKDICSGNRGTSNCSLLFSAPNICNDGLSRVTIPQLEFDVAANQWSNTLVGYVVGKRPYYGKLRSWVDRQWKVKGGIQIHSRENGFFFFKFDLAEDCDHVLEDGPWLLDGALVVLRRWSKTVGLNRDLLSAVPLWIRLPLLPVQLWSLPIIGRIASAVGIPLYTDHATAAGTRLSYARCFVEVDSGSTFPSEVLAVLPSGEEIDVAVEYERHPPLCSHCMSFSHILDHCASPSKPTIPVKAPVLQAKEPLAESLIQTAVATSTVAGESILLDSAVEVIESGGVVIGAITEVKVETDQRIGKAMEEAQPSITLPDDTGHTGGESAVDGDIGEADGVSESDLSDGYNRMGDAFEASYFQGKSCSRAPNCLTVPNPGYVKIFDDAFAKSPAKGKKKKLSSSDRVSRSKSGSLRQKEMNQDFCWNR